MINIGAELVVKMQEESGTFSASITRFAAEHFTLDSFSLYITGLHNARRIGFGTFIEM